MKEMLTSSIFFGVLLCLGTYELGLLIRRRTGISVFNPLLISIALVIFILLSADISYESFYKGSQYISYLLTPATVCLAVPLYEKLHLLKDNFKAIAAGILSGVLTSLIFIFIMCLVFGLEKSIYASMLPKSITTAIGLGISAEIGGIPTITSAVIIITGVFGNLAAEFVIRLFRITEPVAKGIGIGTAAHAIGTAKAMEIGETEGAMSSLSIAVAGLITVVGSSVFINFM